MHLDAPIAVTPTFTDIQSQPKTYPKRLEIIRLLVVSRVRTWIQGRFLGVAWWLLEPLAMTCVYMFLVGTALGVSIENYSLFMMSAILPWTWLQSATSQALSSVKRNQAIVKSVSVDTEVFPIAESVATMIRFAFAISIIVVLMVYYGIVPQYSFALLPVLITIQLVLATGIGLWLSWAYLFFEDVAHAWQVTMRFLFFLSPTLYGIKHLPVHLQSICLLNPFAALIHHYRQVFLGGDEIVPFALCWTAVLALSLFVSGLWLHRKNAGKLALLL